MGRNLKEVETNDAVSLEVGDSIEGIYKHCKEGKYGEIYEIQEEETGEMKVVFGKTILQTKMEKVPVGCYIKIERIADRKTNNGRTAQDFKVLYDEDQAKKLTEE